MYGDDWPKSSSSAAVYWTRKAVRSFLVDFWPTLPHLSHWYSISSLAVFQSSLLSAGISFWVLYYYGFPVLAIFLTINY